MLRVKRIIKLREFILNMSKTEKIFITILAVLFIAVLVEVSTFIWPQITGILLHPTQIVKVIPVSSTEISNLVTYPTGRPTSTPTIYIKKPTWTPPPIETPLLIKISTRPPTPKPNPTLFAAIPAPANPDCSAQYTYIEAMHQYDIDYINYTYNPKSHTTNHCRSGITRIRCTDNGSNSTIHRSNKSST